MSAFVVPKHNAYVTTLSGSQYIAPVFDGTTAAAPGYSCCTLATFENTFTMPAGATSASITITLIADNEASASVNGVLIGAQSMTACNFCGGQAPNTYTVAFTPDPSGTNHLDVTLWDGGGALGLDYVATVNYSVQPPDHTPPVITPTVTGTQGSNGWYTSDVKVTWSVTDPESDVSSKSGCDDATITTDTDGSTITCSATSAGGTNSASVTIKRDATLPTVSYAGNAASYTVDQSVAITCSASDATNPGSGLASSTCQNVSGAAYTFTIGTNTYSATAKDNAGNTGSGSTSFSVAVTSGGLCALTQRWVTKAGVATSLCAKLSAAAASIAAGDMTAKAGQIGAYQNELSAQTGKAIAADKAAILSGLAGQM